MKISLIHPSRGRPQLAHYNYRNWLGKASGNHAIEHWLSLDSNDPELKHYRKLFKGLTNIITADNHNVVQATNAAARNVTGNMIIYLSDDFHCPQNWDSELVNMVPQQPEYLLWVNDGIQGANSMLTIPVMSAALHHSLGYFWHPDYESMWVDVDLWHVCQRRNVLLSCQHLLFEHKHYSIGKAVYDDTYREHDNAARQSQGRSVFERRKAADFMTNGVYR